MKLGKKQFIFLVFIIAIVLFLIIEYLKEPFIISETSEDVCIPFTNETSMKSILLTYRNSNISVEICKFYDKEKTEENFNRLTDAFSQLQYNGINEKIESFEGFLYTEKNDRVIFLMSNDTIFSCKGKEYTQDVCEWFIKNKTGEYL